MQTQHMHHPQASTNMTQQSQQRPPTMSPAAQIQHLLLSGRRRRVGASDARLGVRRRASAFQLALLRLLQTLRQQLLVLGGLLSLLGRSASLLCQAMTFALQNQRSDKSLDLRSFCRRLLTCNNYNNNNVAVPAFVPGFSLDFSTQDLYYRRQ